MYRPLHRLGAPWAGEFTGDDLSVLQVAWNRSVWGLLDRIFLLNLWFLAGPLLCKSKFSDSVFPRSSFSWTVSWGWGRVSQVDARHGPEDPKPYIWLCALSSCFQPDPHAALTGTVRLCEVFRSFFFLFCT